MRIGRSLPPAAAPLYASDLLNGIKGLCRGRQENQRFETELKSYFGVKHCFLVSSGKAGLTLILQALKELMPGREEVVIPAYTCYSVPSAVIRAGLKVSLCDIDSRNLSFDGRMLSSLLNRKKALCVIPTHLFGLPCEMVQTRKICAANGTIIVEDAAQAMGGEHGGEKLGSIGDVGFFSLGRGKALSTVEGGIIVTNREDIAEALRKQMTELGSYGFGGNLILAVQSLILWLFMRPALFWVPKSMPFLGLGKTVYETGFTLKGMSPFQAGLARGWVAKLRRFKDARKEIVKRWQQHSKGKAGAMFINKKVIPDMIRFPVCIPDSAMRTRILEDADRCGLGVMPGYPGPVNRIEQIKELFPNEIYPVAEKVAMELITFPVHPMVTVKDVQRINRLLKKWWEV